MNEKSLQELKDEGTAIGLDLKSVKSKKEASAKIEAHYESLAAESSVDIQEDVEIVEDPIKTTTKTNMNEVARKLKIQAMKTKIVTITNNDKRDNHVTTTCYLSCENQFFGKSKIVPLDEKVELEQCLIDVARGTEVLNHVDEVIDGKRTGNKRPKLVKKYVVAYED